MSDTELMVVDGDVQVDVVGDAGPHMTMLQPLTVGEIEQRYAMLQRFRHAVLRDGVDYGAAGGAEGKPSLLQPGAQKLVVLFGLRAEFTIEDQDEDWTGERHSGEPFFRYRIKCRLYTGDGALAGESYGDINSWESRYRWRWMDEFELPPDLDPGKLRRKISSAEEFEFAIKKGETGGKYGKSPAYWSAWRKAINDGKALPVTITTSKGQQYPGYRMETVRYRVPNDDVFSQINTMIKIGQKRALVGAVLNTTGASEFFTQDLEDFSDDDREMMLRRGERTLESGDRQPDGETGQSETGTQRQPRNVGGNGNGQPEQGNAATGWRAGEGAAMIPALRKLTGLGTADLLAALDTAGSTVNPGMKAEQIAAALKGGTPPVPPTTSGPSKPSAKTPPAPTLPMDADELKARAEPITDPFVYLEAVQARQEKHAALTGEIGAKSRMEIAKLIADAMPDSSPEENVETQAALVRFLFQHTEGLKALSKCEGAVMLDMLTTEDGTVHPWAKSEIEAVVAFLADVDAEEGDHAG